jgi:hypothetical protein
VGVTQHVNMFAAYKVSAEVFLVDKTLLLRSTDHNLGVDSRTGHYIHHGMAHTDLHLRH